MNAGLQRRIKALHFDIVLELSETKTPLEKDVFYTISVFDIVLTCTYCKYIYLYIFMNDFKIC